LCIANTSKPLFSLVLGATCYCIINTLKVKYGDTFIDSAEFRCLSFILPLNFVLLYFLPQSPLISSRNKYLLLGLLTQAALFSYFCSIFNGIPHINITFEAIPLWTCALWIILLTPLAINISFKNTVINTGLFYADTALFLGIIYANSASGQTAFFLSFALILLCTTLLNLHYANHYDELENVGSRTAYFNHANTQFPYKYTIALFSIDNRDKLEEKVLGTKKLAALEQMSINRIRELPYDLSIYRYTREEFIMVFKNENARHVREFADDIRRTIAGTEFIFASAQSIKITISVCVSEKTRKDLDAAEVTERAHTALHKNYRFNCNITTVV
jgi:GGDEF domain-containing protein